MDPLDFKTFLEGFVQSENPNEAPGLQKAMADMRHSDAVQNGPKFDEEKEQAFQQWLQDKGNSFAETGDVLVLRELFAMERDLADVEAAFPDADEDDRGRMLHEFWWRWRGPVSKHEEYRVRYTKMKEELDQTRFG